MATDPGQNHAARRKVLAAWRKVASAAGPPATGQGAASQTVSYFNATVISGEAGYASLYQVQHASGEIYRGVPVMAHVNGGVTIPNSTVVSIRKVGHRLIIDGIPLGNPDAFVGP